jgi:UDP-N-acetylglucosamine 1-carboxyvinyltransferase
MSHFEITGGVALHGEVRVSGAKNAALPIMAAAILADGPVRLENVPRLIDVRTQAQVLRCLGMRVVITSGIKPRPVVALPGATTGRDFMADKNVCPTMILETVDPTPVRARDALVRRMRASFCVLGPLLARRGRAVVPLPGGCNIGNRPVDLHLKGLAALGAEIRLEHGYVVAKARRLTGATIDLRGPDGPTVTGTANVLSAAVLARGITIIHGAAVEPEIVDLGNFLIALGARITGLATPTIRIEGVDQLGGAVHRLIPDRIEAATLLMAAAITRGSATVTGVVPGHITAVLETLQAAGATIDVDEDRVSIRAADRFRAVDIVARPYPGIPTDLQAQWTALLALADGVSTVRDRVFPGRFMHVAELNRLGARIECHNGTAAITGVPRFSGARVVASDLRASAALVLAGLAADGHTIVDRVYHLDRGYQRLERKLRRLGARIERVSGKSDLNADTKTVTICR